jgi:hypothetical protein
MALIASFEAQPRGYDLRGDLVRGGGGEPFTPDGIIGP